MIAAVSWSGVNDSDPFAMVCFDEAGIIRSKARPEHGSFFDRFIMKSASLHATTYTGKPQAAGTVIRTARIRIG